MDKPLPHQHTLRAEVIKQHTKEDASRNIADVRKHLPSNLQFDEEAREKIFDEDKEARNKVRTRHKMAPFRIEVQFSSTRSLRKENVVIIRVWESAKELTGDRDVTMHFCGNEKCHLPFTAQYFSGDVVTCPHCFQMSLRDNCPASLGPVRAQMQEIRAIIAKLFYKLRAEADIVSCWVKKDPRIYAATHDRTVGEEVAARDWERVVYPYWRILDDTIGGQSLDLRLKDFIG